MRSHCSKKMPMTMQLFLASFSSSTIVFFFVSVFLLVGTSDAVLKLPGNLTVTAVIVFGDSIVDPGNNNNFETLARANFPPYGKDLLDGMPTGRFSNGRNPGDFLAEELEIKDLVPAYLDPELKPEDLLTGVSFASGGSGYDPKTPQIAVALPLEKQLEMFQEYTAKLKATVGEEHTNFIIKNSIFLVVFGSNDIVNTYFTARFLTLQYDVDSYTKFLVGSASQFLQDLYKLGARRVAVFGTPPLGCLPSQRTLTGGEMRQCNDKYNEAAQLYNTRLFSEIKLLPVTLNDAQSRILYIDIYNPLLDLIQYPKKYGFMVADKGCCGTGLIEASVLCNKLLINDICSDDSAYVFWDSFHPTQRTYQILVHNILKKYLTSFF